ncbi:MAG: hypothetical protein R3Y29_02835 [bacterium]
MNMNVQNTILNKLYNAINKNVVENSPLGQNQNLTNSSTNSGASVLMDSNNINLSDSLKNFLISLNLEPTDENLNMLDLLMKNSMPINDKNFKTLGDSFNMFDTNELEKALFVMKNEMNLTQSLANQIDSTILKDNSISSQLDNLLNTILKSDNADELLSSIFKNNDVSKLLTSSTDNLQSFKDALKELLSSQKDFTQSSSTKLDESKFHEFFSKLSDMLSSSNTSSNLTSFLKNSTSTAIPEPQDNLSKLIDFLFPKEVVTNNNLFSVLKNAFESSGENLPEANQAPDESPTEDTNLNNSDVSTKEFKSILEDETNEPLNNLNKNPLLDNSSSDSASNTLDKNLDDILKSLISNFKKAGIETNGKELLNLQKEFMLLAKEEPIVAKSLLEMFQNGTTMQNLLKNKFTFDIENSDQDDLNLFFKELSAFSTKLKQSLDDMQNGGSLGSGSGNGIGGDTSALTELSKTIDFFNAIKDAFYLQIPLNINDFNTTAELFIFKDGQNGGSKASKKTASALVSINLLNLGNIEVFLNKIENDLYLQFRLEEDFVEDLIRNNQSTFESYLQHKNLKLKDIKFTKLEESFSIIANEYEEFRQYESIDAQA